MKSKYAVKSKIAVSAVLGLLLFALVACSYNSDSSSKETPASQVEETANNETEHAKTDNETNDVIVEREINEESTEVNEYDAVDKCYEDLVANNNAKDWSELSKQIRELADKYGLYQDSKNNGLGVRYAKIATTSDEAKVISNGDIDKGTYYIRIVADFSKGSPDIQLVDNTKQSADMTPTESEKTPEELYFEQVKHDAEWNMMPRDECKTVTLEDRTLRLEIYLTRTDKLLERYTDISDAILAIESGYDWWDTLVIDFGSLGIVTKTKDDLVDGHFEVTKDDFIKN